MRESCNEIIQNDINEIVNNIDYIDFNEFNNKTVLITGSSGLIGSQLVELFACISNIKKLNIKIIATGRNKERLEKRFSHLTTNKNIKFIELNIDDESKLDIRDDVNYIIHAASPTSSKFFVTNPVETLNTTIHGTNKILELAKQKKVEAMVYLSSLEVYGIPYNEDVKENDYGYIDNLSIRSSYSEGKRATECLCSAYASEYNVNVKIARLSQTFGPGVIYEDGRVFAEFVRCAIEKRDIVLHTKGNTLRTYCYTKDALSAILTILLKGEKGEAYNVTNPDTAVTIREMAEMVCKLFADSNINLKIEIPEDVGKFGYNPEMKIRLNIEKISNLGWKPTVKLEKMFLKLKQSMEKEKYYGTKS